MTLLKALMALLPPTPVLTIGIVGLYDPPESPHGPAPQRMLEVVTAAVKRPVGGVPATCALLGSGKWASLHARDRPVIIWDHLVGNVQDLPRFENYNFILMGLDP